MQWKYTLSEPTLGEEEQRAAVECLNSGWLSMGSRTIQFEEKFSELVGCKHAIAVTNGTAALHLAMLALDIGRGKDDEVIQPSINFVAGANMTIAVGAKPIFADIVSPIEPTIDPNDIESLIGPNTKAVMVMHFGGYAAQMSDITKICSERGIPIIEDACHATGYRSPADGGQGLGTIGAIGCYSFFANKNMTTGEGGMVVTNNDALADRLRNLRSHGMTTLSWERHQGRASSYDVLATGYNYRTDDLRSALGLAQIEKLPAANKRRAELALAYAEAIDRIAPDRVRYVNGHRPLSGSGHVAGVLVDPSQRDQIRKDLAEQGIQTSMHYPPVHEFTAFAGLEKRTLPKTQEFAASMITLPLHPNMGNDCVEEIVMAIAKLCQRKAA